MVVISVISSVLLLALVITFFLMYRMNLRLYEYTLYFVINKMIGQFRFGLIPSIIQR